MREREGEGGREGEREGGRETARQTEGKRRICRQAYLHAECYCAKAFMKKN